ncbi:MAG: phosphodiester glycosidase family protein [Desulfarculaceae bacterium]|nr:phosphodiester glycosidase family protein [Desulfarculaceae bacterium]MCF8070913.1 phosphodiester glycosidase family protein [Desulfarculaceae bacterium]MCF8100501.1 phosphodiester glycosidase family protein [Desulfarculaceae bacterium]MCF8116527.1 phosphodiester glycosidase family protein [Desulfarculaceae bacterium]
MLRLTSMALVPLLAGLLCCPWPAWSAGEAKPPELRWRSLAPGLEFTLSQDLAPARSGGPGMAILRIDPQRYDFKVLAAPEGEEGRTAEQWQEESKALAVFNAGLYTPEGRHLGYLLANGRRLSPMVPQQDGIFLAGPKSQGQPRARIIDLRYTSFDPKFSPYTQAAQSLMLLDRFGQVRVRRSPKVASRTALASDQQGRILVLVTEGGHTLWELAQALKASGLGLREVMTLDGGAESQLEIRHGDFSYAHYGRPSTAGDLPWPRRSLPAALAVFPKK